MRKIFVVMISFLVFSCASFVPTIEHPAPGLWCADWTIYGQTIKVCAESPLLLQQKLATLKAKQAEQK